MSRGVNKVILIGHLGGNPETRFTPQGNAVSNFSVATDESYKDAKTGQVVPRTEWHSVVCFNRLAEIARDYLKKGSKVYIEGRLQTRKWQDKQSVDHYTTEIVAGEIQMLDGRSATSGQPPESAQAYEQQPEQQRGHVRESAYKDNPRGPSHPAPADGDFDDDIPF